MSDGPTLTVYLRASVRDNSARGSRPAAAWSLRLQRWPPDEVYRIIVETFTKLAAEEDEAKRKEREPEASTV
jgi:hypothetical protein